MFLFVSILAFSTCCLSTCFFSSAFGTRQTCCIRVRVEGAYRDTQSVKPTLLDEGVCDISSHKFPKVIPRGEDDENDGYDGDDASLYFYVRLSESRLLLLFSPRSILRK